MASTDQPPPPIFHFPIHAPLASSKVKLVPFSPALHSAAFVAQSQGPSGGGGGDDGRHAQPDLFAHVPTGPFPGGAEQLNAEFHAASPGASVLALADPNVFAFAIIDTTRAPARPGGVDPDGELAGMVSFINTSPANRSTEVGMVVVLPAYQRTHVASHAVGLLLNYAFAAAPGPGGGGGSGGGLGLARVHWHCSAANEASILVAERMGYERVGVIPYHVRFPKGRLLGKVGNGRALPPGADPDDLWRDTMVFSLSWDVWEREGKEKVRRAMDR